MITQQIVHKILLDYPDTWVEYPFGDHIAVYKHGDMRRKEGQMFALIKEGSRPLSVSLKCDPLLARNLREKYESVLPGDHLNPKHWNTLICSGQLSDEEIIDLTRHSYLLVSESR